MAIYDNIWQCMAIYGNSLQFIAIHCDLWQFMATDGNSWQFIAIHGISWQFMTIYGNSWQFMAIHGNSWQCMAISIGKWWFQEWWFKEQASWFDTWFPSGNCAWFQDRNNDCGKMKRITIELLLCDFQPGWIGGYRSWPKIPCKNVTLMIPDWSVSGANPSELVSRNIRHYRETLSQKT